MRLLFAVSLLLAALPIVAAYHDPATCDPYGPALGVQEIGSPSGTYYFEDRGTAKAFADSWLWPITEYHMGHGGWYLYEETNGASGLQRGGVATLYFGPEWIEDACWDVEWDADTLLYCDLCTYGP